MPLQIEIASDSKADIFTAMKKALDENPTLSLTYLCEILERNMCRSRMWFADIYLSGKKKEEHGNSPTSS